MGGSVTLSKASLGKLLDQLGTADPHAPDLIGPGGTFIRTLEWILLNPQPLPPRERHGPEPAPWHARLLARATIGRALERYETASIIVVGGSADRALEVASPPIDELVVEFLALLNAGSIDAATVVVAASQLDRVADVLASHPLQPGVERAANQLFEAGIASLNGQVGDSHH